MTAVHSDSAQTSREPDFARTPPQDIVAEQSVLGGMMLSKDAIADVVEVLRGNDFYRPAHESIYEAIIDLYGRGEPADAVTVSDLLTKRGEISRIGGPAYLHTLIQSVPTAANAGFYAEIVRERAVLRRLVDAGTKIVQLGYSQDGEVDDIVNQAQAEIYTVAERRSAEDYVPLKDIIEGTVDEIESAGHRGEGMTGVPTGFYELDELTQGLHAGQMIVIAARPAVGKALALDTPLPTPTGWTTMGEVQAGDEVLAADGTPTLVVAATEVMQDRPCYEVTFDDGSVLVADAEHEWLVEFQGDEKPFVATTMELDSSLGSGLGVLVRNQAGALNADLASRDVWKIETIEKVPSVPVRCIQVAHESHLYLAGRSFIPTHNSTFALDFARSAAIKHNMTTVFFSLEMGRNEIAMRLLSAEATIGLQDLRKGTIKDEQWGKIATTMGRMNDAPLFIDDSPNMSLMEIRAKCRRLKQRHDLKLIVLDYLQLMSSGKRVESRQQEVSEFSRALKLLAKELEVPVIALSQLNRGSEQRTDKKPMVSDLRESGCLTADTRVLRSDTGAETTMGELFASGANDVPVWSLDDSLRYVERHLTHVFSTGVKPVYRLTLASGKTVRATANHPFFTYEGWKPLGELTVGDRLGVPRHVNGPALRTHWDDGQVITAAKILGANSSGPMSEQYELEDGHVSDAIAFIPNEVFALPKQQIALFLGQLWSVGGAISFDGTGQGSISFASGSRLVVEAVSRLLLRFGISAEITPTLTGFTLFISEGDDQRRFLQEINAHSGPTQVADDLLATIRGGSETAPVPSIPEGVWNDVRSIMEDSSQPALGAVTAVLDRAELDVEAINDLRWDEVLNIVPDGEEEVFDATVLGNHNFIANGIAVHNSIEQDADMVILLHREDIYDKESPRAGEADVIVAKHRNGPTKTIVVGFQGHYSRFANMAVEAG
ncbi:replicative DNA helicase [Arthrobacter crystallopoietes BAB-32]|uniref:Replicative DNA helicase n=1 Tax=Arthrobacter crystallopoietes BAB-32 TaxID=1246476 RepID=N1UXX8_9MICC|nr:replicative DNA helicase [Arthrobacter crystallopoietes]EMY32702.1 replicative DNA helicase [Arthrobacter crystallopoietes BAB-32]